MSSEQERMRELFLDEFEEHVEMLCEGFVAFSRDPGQANSRITELFRAAHSMKGAAQVVGIRPVATLADRMETILARLRDGDLEPTEAVLQPLVDSADVLDDMVRRMRAGEDISEAGSADVIQSLTAIAADEELPSVDEGSARPVAPDPQQQRTSVRVPVGRLDMLLEHADDLDVSHQQLGQTMQGMREVRDTHSRHARAWRELAHEFAELQSALPPRVSAILRRAEATWQDTDKAVREATPAIGTRVRELGQIADALGQATTRLRMAPLSEACDGLERSVRQASRMDPESPKSVEFNVDGLEIELERQIVAGLRDALNHLVRNAVDHGIESPDERRDAGKDPVGHVTVRGGLDGGRAVISVGDDGRGLDELALAAAAERHGLTVSVDDLSELAFAPGLSTSAVVTDISGRGVGLDAVRARVEQLGGWVTLDSEPGLGTTVSLSMPTTLSRFHAVLVEAGGETLALPTSGVNRVVRTPMTQIETVAGHPAIITDAGPVRLLSLARALGFDDRASSDVRHVDAVVVAANNEEVALAVDRLVGESETTARNLGERLAGAPGVLGATHLPTGQVVLVLNLAACVRIGLAGSAAIPTVTPQEPRRTPRVLLADDSLTTRSLEQSILEAAGYDVLPAADGLSALRRLERDEVDLVVTDVDMPRMSGLELCEAIRRSPRHAQLPIVLVTSLASDDDRRRGLEAGANAYITKSAFDQGDLLEILARLL